MQIDFSSPTVMIAIAVAVLLLVIVIAVIVQSRKKASNKLRQRFGAEYDRTVIETGSERKAELKLAERQAQVEKLKLRELGVAQRDRFVSDWNLVQSRFVDHPKGAVMEADELISSLLQARGYPASSFEQSAEFISVDHPRMIEQYREAHAIAVRSGRGEASTEELRTAMIQYRTLFDELVQVDLVTHP
jgi:hypothetical protein